MMVCYFLICVRSQYFVPGEKIAKKIIPPPRGEGRGEICLPRNADMGKPARWLTHICITSEYALDRSQARVLGQHGSQVGLGGGNGFDLELLHQEVEHIGRNESRQGGAEVNVFDAQRKQSQQNADRFLFVP